ncbi:MAG TPA: TonB-dependent hemoglobin/transferrin/lactoferrin family receptor [Rhabdaerophilum sp.]|nr:TonB-dependent hemoglobin/transferrin/lactoferrin family receptor [Rhabdaerophilum sp.]
MGIAHRRALAASVSLLALGALNFAGPAFGQAQPATEAPLEDITVTATRTEERSVDALAPVTVTNRQEIRRQTPQRIGTIISQIPGVTTQENPNDPATSINIRGLQDFGRVAVTIDGARQNFQRSGHNANGAFFLDPAFIRMIDVTRGPVANVYGSGAIGGVASFTTVEPRDILRPGEKFATELGFTGVLGGRQNGVYGHGIGAMRANDWASALLGLSFRDLNAYKDGGGNVIRDSGQELVSGLGKIVLTPGDGHTIKLSGQLQKYDFANGLGTSTSPRRTNDVRTSNLVASYSFSRPDNDWLNLNVSAYRTTTDTDQARISGTPAQIGNKRFFKIATYGVDASNTSRFTFGAVKMALTYGADFFEDRVKTSDPFSNGDETTPGGRRLVYGSFIQNHLQWNRFDLITALRFDGYELAGGGNSSSGQRVSPKLTLGYTIIEGIQPYVTYAEGYRAPAITETLVNGLHPVPSTFTFIPNPNLRPEIGKTLEAGLNLKFDNVLKEGDRLRGKFSVFQNRVNNYIEGVFSDPGNDCGNPFIPAGCADATYTYRNIARARLRGIEGEIAYDARRWFASLSGSMVRGDNLTLDQPLESVYPDKIALAGGLRFLDEKLVLGGRVTLVAKQNRLPAASIAANASKAYALVDANVSYEFAKDSRFFALVENIGDVRYRRYRDGDRSPGLVTKFGFTTRLGI